VRVRAALKETYRFPCLDDWIFQEAWGWGYDTRARSTYPQGTSVEPQQLIGVIAEASIYSGNEELESISTDMWK